MRCAKGSTRTSSPPASPSSSSNPTRTISGSSASRHSSESWNDGQFAGMTLAEQVFRQEQQHLDVDCASLGALGGDEGGDFGERDAVDDDLLVRGAAAFAGAGQAVGAEQAEAFGDHAGRGVIITELGHGGGAIAGFFLELADRRTSGRLAFLLVADQARGQL